LWSDVTHPFPRYWGGGRGEKLTAKGNLGGAFGISALYPQPLLPWQPQAWKEKNRLYLIASLLHKSLPSSPHQPNTEKNKRKEKELIRAADSWEIVTRSFSHALWCQVKKKKRMHSILN
jgi:hypothetical protein